MKADAAAQAAQDQVALLTARFDVRRAELDASGNEFVGAIDAQKNELSLEEAQAPRSRSSRRTSSRAPRPTRRRWPSSEEKRNKATLAMQRAQAGDRQPRQLKAPMDGVVSIKENRDAMGGMMIWGMPMPEYRAGDSVWPGRPVADVIEYGPHGAARQGGRERSRESRREGQQATVDDRLDSRASRSRRASGALSGSGAARRHVGNGQRRRGSST